MFAAQRNTNGVRGKRLVDSCVSEERENFKKFKALIATPGNLTTGISLPANAQVVLSYSATLAASAPLVDASTTSGVRALGMPASVAGTHFHVGKLSRATALTKHSGVVGTVSVYYRNGLGHLFLIAQG